ncbi:hypothetical protein L602_000400000180 [Cupriavidus gilardii J11]|uniref:Uncharacterized protein n=1 Tax=Cupriavidus gilardii J11 TaxID=936133 RepID=A0A562B9Q8_9BURK|nr:hypothetical protein [Cupriavidus gilardii]TWG81699.1 hypothetical protein L602_000400000180 [Cupriavidus gilardii J11]
MQTSDLKSDPERFGRLAALGAAVVLSGLAGGALAAPMEPQTAGPFTYVCGGVGEDEQQALRSEARNYDMGLLFTQGARGEYLSDVEVTLSRGGKQVANFRAEGPRCLIKGPRGTYQVTADYLGSSKRTTLSAGQRNKQLRW